MPESETSETDPRIDEVTVAPLSLRDKIVGWLVVSGIVALVGFSIFREVRTSGFAEIVWFGLGLLVVIFVGVLWLFVRGGHFTWLRLAGRPTKEMLGGKPEKADRVFQKAMARAMRFAPDDRRRGVMLCELSVYLGCRGRCREARTLAEEAVAILTPYQRKEAAYWAAVKNLAIFLTDFKEYQAAQTLLSQAVDNTVRLKKPVDDRVAEVTFVPSNDFDFLLQSILVYLLTEANELAAAEHHLVKLDELFSQMSPRLQTDYRTFNLVLRAHCHCAMRQFAEAERLYAEVPVNPNDRLLVRLSAQIDLARHDFVGAERTLRGHLDAQQTMAPLHRPNLLPHTVLLAEALFGQAKHDDAIASFEEARSIVADFALPADDAWRKTLATWLQRAKDLGETELAESLEKELAQAAATPNQAITILEKFRIQPPAST
jgi:tetratricopeptide (TPR) repeat protein